MKKGISIAATLMTLMYCSSAFAEEPVTVLDYVVVTATRTDTTADKVGGTSVTVLNEEDIAAKQRTTVEERMTPGITLDWDRFNNTVYIYVLFFSCIGDHCHL